MFLPLRSLLCLALVLAVPAWAHTAHKHAPAANSAAPEQKDWGIAGEPAKVNRTITITMGDDMHLHLRGSKCVWARRCEWWHSTGAS